MPVRVEKNEVRKLKRRTRRNTKAALADVADATKAAMRARIPVSDLAKDHLVETVDSDEEEGRDDLKVIVSAGGPTAPYPWFVEAGTGRHHDPPETEDAAPPGGGRDEWVYFNPYLGMFVTTSGNRAQPFAGPAYEVGREVAMDRLSKVVR